MTAYKAHQVREAVQAPPKTAHGFLIFGTDAGQVSERAATLAGRLSARSSPPGEIIRLSDQDLAETPGVLLTETQTLPMFGGRKVVWVKAGSRLSVDQLAELFDGGPPAASVIVEAGNLRKDSKLRLLFEERGALAALPCYGAESADLTLTVSQTLKEAGLDITPEALRQVTEGAGGDLGLARAEARKLALYAAGEGVVTLEHVEAICGDGAALVADDVIVAVFSGNPQELFRQVDRFLATGASVQTLLIVMTSYLMRLHQTRVAADAGENPDAVMKSLRPPIPFRQEEAFKRQRRVWTAPRLASALALVQDAMRQARLQWEHDVELSVRALMLVTLEARRISGRGR